MGVDFVFHPQVHRNPKNTRKRLRLEKKLKKSETRGKTRWKPKNPQKKHIYKIRRAPEPDLKPDGFKFRCQFSPAGTGSSVKFNLTLFFHRSNFQSTQSEPDSLPSLPIIYNLQHKPLMLQQTSMVSLIACSFDFPLKLEIY
jgi:hypothetical protein